MGPSCINGAPRAVHPKGNGVVFPNRADAAESRDARKAVLPSSDWPHHPRIGSSGDRVPRPVMHPALENWEGRIQFTPGRTPTASTLQVEQLE